MGSYALFLPKLRVSIKLGCNGVSRYLMTTGDRQNTYALLPFIEKALRYQLSRFSEDDVLLSDSDELENRFLSGSANLSTQCIAYDAFISLSYLFEGIGKSDKAAEVRNAAQRVRRGIKNYFAAEVEGYDTYRYCKEEDKLRSWICLPLTVGIEDRKKRYGGRAAFRQVVQRRRDTDQKRREDVLGQICALCNKRIVYRAGKRKSLQIA